MDKRRKTLIFVGVVVVATASIYRFYPAIGGLKPSRDAILIKQREIYKYRKIISEQGNLETKLRSLENELEKAEAGLLSGQTSALAAADIQNILNKIAGQVGVEFQTLRVVETEKENKSKYLSIPVQFRISCTIEQLKQLLFKIESSQKYLKVDSVRIDVRSRGESSLYADMTVVGFMKNPGASAVKSLKR